jgi:hypothetical protein
VNSWASEESSTVLVRPLSASMRLCSTLLLLLLLRGEALSVVGGWLLERLLLLRVASSHSVPLPARASAAAAAAADSRGLSSALRLLRRDRCVLVCWPDTCLLLRSCTELRSSSDFASSVSSSSITACTGRSAASGGRTTGVLSPLALLLSWVPAAGVGVTAVLVPDWKPVADCPAVPDVAGSTAASAAAAVLSAAACWSADSVAADAIASADSAAACWSSPVPGSCAGRWSCCMLSVRPVLDAWKVLPPSSVTLHQHSSSMQQVCVFAQSPDTAPWHVSTFEVASCMQLLCGKALPHLLLWMLCRTSLYTSSQLAVP